MAILLAALSALTYGTADYLGGKASRRVSSVSAAFVGQAVSGLVMVVIVLLAATPAPAWPSFVWGAAAGCAGALGIVLFYTALAGGNMSVVAPVSAVVGVSLPVIVGLAQGDRPRWMAYVGFPLAAGAIALVSGLALSAGAAVPTRMVAMAIGAGAGFGLMYVLLAQTDQDSGLWPLVAVRGASVPLIGLAALLRGGVRAAMSRSILPLVIACGCLDLLGNALYLLAVRRDLLSIVAVISAMYPVSTVLLAARFDGERVQRSQLVGMGVGVAAVTLIALGAA
jgi:drug/metabolite transporter (DMT)-like permease